MMASLRSATIAASLLAIALFVPRAPAQTSVAPDAGCVPQRETYVCNWSSFKTVFDRARTAAVEASPRDRTAARQLTELIRDLGKTPAEASLPADLNLLLAPVEPTGVNLGPMDHDLATLRIYAPQADSPHGTLLWVETLRGQGDRPWPAQVHALITQFHDRFKGSGR